MAFDEDLRTYLEGLERESPGGSRRPQRTIDENDLHQHFLERLRDLANPRVVEHMHSVWTPRISPLARHVERLPMQTAPRDAAGALAFARRLLDVALGVSVPDLPFVDQLELRRILGEFRLGSFNLETYALEARLTSRHALDSLPGLTTLGRAFWRLRGKDAVRWLLTIECALNQGTSDQWRISRELLEEAIRPEGLVMTRDFEGVEQFRFNDAMIDHAVSMGVLVGWVADPEEPPYKYSVADEMRDIVQKAIEPGPWHATIAALLEDDRAAVVSVPTSGASDAVLDQTRMITHELRNALVPVRHHIDAILGAETSPTIKPRAEAARRGVVRVLEFVEQMVTVAEVASEPLTTLDLASMVEESIARTDGDDRVTLVKSQRPIRVEAIRSSLVTALANLVRNALQAGGPKAKVEVSLVAFADSVRVSVDDDGPGIALEDRRKVFNDGFTTKPGGSGFGLTHVKSVVEHLRGKVWCEESRLGGARFVIELPINRSRA